MIEIISIGDELLHGATLNTNAKMLCEQLYAAGFEVARITTVPDEKMALQAGLKEALERSKVVITTGGLGPTLDDSTKTTVAEMMGSELQFDQTYFDHLMQVFGQERETFRLQSTVPVKAKLLYNHLGTAPGFIFEEAGLVLLPGVPSELEKMWSEAFSWIDKRLEGVKRVVHKRMTLALIREQQVDPILRELKEKHANLSFGIYPSYGYVGLRISDSDSKMIDAAMADVTEAFPTQVMAYHDVKPEEIVHETLIKQGQTLAVAESCTGGSIASRITSLPNSSEYFLGGVVSYSNAAKMKLLGMSEKTLDAHGAVSKETALEMLAGVFDRFDSDWGVAVTGIAGPSGGSEDRSVGTVWMAMGKRGKEPLVGCVPRLRANFARHRVIRASGSFAFAGLWSLMTHGTSPFEVYA